MIKIFAASMLLILAPGTALCQGQGPNPEGHSDFWSQECNNIRIARDLMYERIRELVSKAYDTRKEWWEVRRKHERERKELEDYVVGLKFGEARPTRSGLQQIRHRLASLRSSTELEIETTYVQVQKRLFSKAVTAAKLYLELRRLSNVVCPEDDTAAASTAAAGTPAGTRVKWACNWHRGRILPPYLARFKGSPDQCRKECERRIPECMAYTRFETDDCYLSAREPRFSGVLEESGGKLVSSCTLQRNGGEER